MLDLHQQNTNPFLNEEPTIKTEPILDLFGGESMVPPAVPTSQATNALDDLLSLGNPFADFSGPAASAPPPSSNGNLFGTAPTSTTAASNMWANGFVSNTSFQPPPTQTTFASNNLSGLFNTNEPSVFDPIPNSDNKQPIMAQPTPQQLPPQRPGQTSKILTGDLESSLTSLVENLTMDSGNRSNQWNSPKNQPKNTIGWQPAPAGIIYRPMPQPMMMMGQQPIQYPMGAVQNPVQGSPKMVNPQIQAQQPIKQDINFDPFGDL